MGYERLEQSEIVECELQSRDFQCHRNVGQVSLSGSQLEEGFPE